MGPAAAIRVFFYARCACRRRGKAICANAAEVPLTLADEKVLAAIEQDLLQPEVIERAVARALELLKGEGGVSAAQRNACLLFEAGSRPWASWKH